MRKQWWLKGGAGVAAVMVVALFVLGGPLSYVSTSGASMEPHFSQGDLVLLRSVDTYQVGDVVAYHSQLLDAVIMHRIVNRDGDRYLFKGDNNSWIDPDKPTRTELIGTSWLRVPLAGSALSWLRAHWPLLPGIALLMASVGTTRRHRRRKPGTHVRSRRTATSPQRMSSIPQQLLPATAAGLIAFLALGAVVYTRPTTQPHPSDVAYTQQRGFAYSAVVPTGPVYGAMGVTTGDPLFLQLVTAADVHFTYRLESSSPRAVTGTVSLTAEVSDQAGWHRIVELSPPTAFRGDETEVRATLDVARLQTMIAEVQSLTGMKTGTHTVTVAAHVQIEGTVAGQTLQKTFDPGLVFRLDALQLWPTWARDSTTGQDPLAPSEPGSVTTTGSAASQLSALGYHLAVDQARILALAGALSSAIALAVGLIARRPQRRNENARIHAKHGHRIIPVDAAEGDVTRTVLDITTMADLARLAEQYDCLMLHQEHDDIHSYLFQVDRTIYRYRIQNRAPVGSCPAPLE